ncbi:DUF1385 domain-containing protein [Lachnospiraceae bacterium ZAX-1]
MASSGIGGQAVMEGVMMKHKDRYAVAVRKADKEIIVETKDFRGICKNDTVKNIPIIRGVVNFIDSFVLGMSTLAFSASFFEEEDERKADELELDEQKANEQKADDLKSDEKKAKAEKAVMGFTIFLSVLLAVGIFMVLPYGISLFFSKMITSATLLIVLEGVLRLLIFICYIFLISKMKEIQRVFMYHGAEHKCINCIEHGLALNLENVKSSSRQHKRCGTSFLFFVMIVSIIATMFIRVDSRVLRLLLRLAIIPLIAGISYEIIRLAGRSDNFFVNLISRPGLWMQKLTTLEPEDSMIEVGIASVEAVFDWREYLANNTKEEH